MITVGITGGIGSGKSIVCKIFEMLGVPVFYADEQAKQLYDSSKKLKSRIIKHFGSELYPDNVFDKNKMKKIVFSDPDKLRLLNSLVHPMVIEVSDAWMREQNGPYALKEAALLIESGAYKDLDEIIHVECPPDVRIKRVMKRDGLTETQILSRIQAQMPDEEKKKYANHSILNDDQHLIIPQVLVLHDYFLQKSVQQIKAGKD